ncbi:helix-turn-helix domain-containing protein [Oceanithermus sp.]
MDKSSLPRMLSVDRVAMELSLSTRSVYRLIKRGAIKAKRVGGVWRIPRSELERIVRRGLEVKG